MELPILHRRITTSVPSNGPDCFSTCAGLSPPPSPLNNNNPHRHVSNLFIAAACLIAAFFFLALTYYAVFNRRRRRRRPFFESQPPDGDDFVEADADHHIWHIRTLGLDEATIASIAICEFKASIGARDCSVCLADFADGELVRLLPKCAHAFHVQCIDTWLRAHVNCPICRSLVTAPGEEFGSAGVRDNSPLGTQESDTNPAVLTEGEEVEASSDSLLLFVSDVEEGGDKRIRRSVSMVDLPHCGSLPIGDSEDSFREEERESCSKNGEKQGSSSKEVEKSVSGRGFFFSKSRRTQSLVLPL